MSFQYKVIKEFSGTDHLEEQVTKLLNDDWELVGPAQVAIANTKNDYGAEVTEEIYTQTMIKRDYSIGVAPLKVAHLEEAE